MRYFAYFILIFVLCVVAGITIAGRRGSISRKPPLYVFPDMERQLKLRPQNESTFFTNGYTSQLHVTGTVPRSTPIETASGPVYSFEDSPVNTGRITGTTNFVLTNPLAINAQLVARGQQRFTIYCTPCHSQLGDGNGITKRIGAMAVVANLHDKRIVELPDGEIFNTITYGKNLMGPYGPNVVVEDRWAIVAYLRALQLSQLGLVDDVPEQMRSTLSK
ncbi:MAG TPA: cytochrome c [Verrucomicrobiae bacterium]|nr:cytochrome c [Verrucomicrobiae bacterium]